MINIGKGKVTWTFFLFFVNSHFFGSSLKSFFLYPPAHLPPAHLLSPCPPTHPPPCPPPCPPSPPSSLQTFHPIFVHPTVHLNVCLHHHILQCRKDGREMKRWTCKLLWNVQWRLFWCDSGLCGSFSPLKLGGDGEAGCCVPSSAEKRKKEEEGEQGETVEGSSITNAWCRLTEQHAAASAIAPTYSNQSPGRKEKLVLSVTNVTSPQSRSAVWKFMLEEATRFSKLLRSFVKILKSLWTSQSKVMNEKKAFHLLMLTYLQSLRE